MERRQAQSSADGSVFFVPFPDGVLKEQEKAWHESPPVVTPRQPVEGIAAGSQRPLAAPADATNSFSEAVTGVPQAELRDRSSSGNREVLAANSLAPASQLNGDSEFTPGREAYAGISGMSILGLSDDPDPADEPPSQSHWLLYLATGVLSGLIMLAGVHYHLLLRDAGLQYWSSLRAAETQYWPPLREVATRNVEAAAANVRQLREELSAFVLGTPATVAMPPAQETRPAVGPAQPAVTAQGGRTAEAPTQPMQPMQDQRPAAAPPASQAAEGAGQDNSPEPAGNTLESKTSQVPQSVAAPIAPRASSDAAAVPEPASRPAVNAVGPAGERNNPSRNAPPLSQMESQKQIAVAAPAPLSIRELPPPSAEPEVRHIVVPPHAKAASAEGPHRPPAGQAEYQQAVAAADPEVARALLWRSVSLGNPAAEVRLGEMYIYGQGVPANCEQGIVLLRSAALAGYSPARSKLGALYATGKCVARDRVEAYRWLSLALEADPGSEWVTTNRQMVWNQMSFRSGPWRRTGRPWLPLNELRDSEAENFETLKL